MAEEKNVDIPTEIHVSCPLRKHHLVPVRRCDGCPHFHGLEQMMGNDTLPFEHVYAVRCAFPISRKLSHVERDV